MLIFFVMGQVNLAWATHYCGDELMSSEVSLAPEKSDCCGDEMPKEMDCCESDITVVDSDDFFGKSEIKVNVSPEFALALTFTFFNIELPVEIQTWGDISSHAPPTPDLTILYQTFLI